MKIAIAIVALVVVAWWWIHRGPRRAPTATEVQAAGYTFEELEELLAKVDSVKNPANYARFLYIRAYGRSPTRRTG